MLHDASESNFRKLKSDVDFTSSMLCDILKTIGPTYLILDGIDELDEVSWKHLLSTVLQLHETCPETKLFISSRKEREIALILKAKSIPVRIDRKNHVDIDAFVRLEGENLLDQLKSYGADMHTCLKARDVLETIVDKAEGKLKWIHRSCSNANNTLQACSFTPGSFYEW